MSKRNPDPMFQFMAMEALASPEYAALCRKTGLQPWGPPATKEDVRKAKEAYYKSLEPRPTKPKERKPSL